MLVTCIVHADNIRPAYLEINETEPGNLSILWKIPYGLDGKPLDLTPAFPDSFKTSSLANKVEAPDGVIRKWTMLIEDDTLSGARIGINGLEQNTTDAMIRVRLAEGASFRAVLRPTEPAVTIEPGTRDIPPSDSFLLSSLRVLDQWRYLFLLPVAWWISLRLRTRRWGLLACAVVLISGAGAGHVLGQSDWLAKQTSSSATEPEIKRVLQGLMLNTYRAFMLEDDELIYDCLARSVDGDFLGDVFLQNREILSMQEEEAALTLVNGLDVKSIDRMTRDRTGRIHLRAQWDVYGKVHHWQHVHFRCNTYESEVTLVPAGDYWKLTEVRVLNEERVL